MSRRRQMQHLDRAFLQSLRAKGAKPSVNIIHHKPIIKAFEHALKHWETTPKGKSLDEHQEALVLNIENACNSHSRHLSIWACLQIFQKTRTKQRFEFINMFPDILKRIELQLQARVLHRVLKKHPYNHEQTHYTACQDDDHIAITVEDTFKRIAPLMTAQPPYTDKRVAVRKSCATFWQSCCGADVINTEIRRTYHEPFSRHAAHYLALQSCIKEKIPPITCEQAVQQLEDEKTKAGFDRQPSHTAATTRK